MGVHASWTQGSGGPAAASSSIANEDFQGEDDEFCVESVRLPLSYIAKFQIMLECSAGWCR